MKISNVIGYQVTLTPKETKLFKLICRDYTRFKIEEFLTEEDREAFIFAEKVSREVNKCLKKIIS
jgi:hypothetical protein